MNSHDIPARTLTVFYATDDQNQKALTYKLGPHPTEETGPEFRRKAVRWPGIDACIQQVRDRVHQLLIAAIYGYRRGDVEVDEPAQALSKQVLPTVRLEDLLQPGFHPQFDTFGDKAAEIPWEALEEEYYICPGCDWCVAPSEVSHHPPHCEKDGREMQLCAAKLSVRYHVTHCAYGGGPAKTGGKTFLMIEDPRGDLCDPNDPQGICANHLIEARQTLPAQGYDVLQVAGQNATRERVLDALASPELAGIYYFGHAAFPTGGDEGYLVLSDGLLYAREIKAASPSAGIVFVNACEAAAVPNTWSLAKNPLNVAGAFAGSKVVIAPMWPIANTHAAQAALTFFREAASGVPLARALQVVREESLKRYNNDMPDICWMAYRYFGDPNRRLSVPSVVPQVPVARGAARRFRERVFDEEDRLDTDVFAFAVDEILLRAAKRRNLQRRRLVSVADLIAGLIRKGELTRYALQREGKKPDHIYQIYKKVGEHEESGERVEEDLYSLEAYTTLDAESDPEERKRKLAGLLEMWIVRGKGQFALDLIELLTRVDHAAQERHSEAEDPRISEQDILEQVIREDAWEELEQLGLPPVEAVQRAIERHAQDGIDENGYVRLDDLDTDAKRVIDDAHVLAQQRGVHPIPNRALLAAFLAEKNGYAARLFRFARTAVTPRVLCEILRATLGTEESSESFGLSHEACEHIVTPVLKRAREIARESEKITERDLFRAFCEKADPRFKQSLKQQPFYVDLDRLKTLDPPEEMPPGPDEADGASRGPDARIPGDDQQTTPGQTAPGGGDVVLDESAFEASAQRVINRAMEFARGAGRSVVNTPHLFAAMVELGAGPLAAFPSHRDMDAEKLKNDLLSLIPAQGSPLPATHAMGFSRNTQKVLGRAHQIAAEAGRQRANDEDLFISFFADGGGVVGQFLISRGLEMLTRGGFPSVGGAPQRTGRGRPILEQLGDDLTEKARRGRLPEIVGRDREIETALQTLMLSESANPLLIGEAGVGKTAIVEGMAQRIAEGKCPKKLRGARVVALQPGSLVANTPFRGEFEKRMQDLLTEVKGQDVVLFIDEIHTIVGAGAGGIGTLDAGNMLKAALARGELRLVGATTPSECKRTIERDKALLRRFQRILINPPSREATIHILRTTRKALKEHHGVRITDPAIEAAVDLSGRHIHDKQWPAKARDVLDHACAVAASEAESGNAASATADSVHVARAISNMTGLPLEEVSSVDQAVLATLEERLSGRIIGQSEAIRTVAEAIRRGRQGLANANRPWGVFLFVGPTGVGKTELGKALAEEVFGAPDGLIRFDMGDFAEPHSKARLIGAPPGYIGYEEGSPLVERLRARPYSLLLFDEIEHAHEEVLATLLRLFSEGTITDSYGTVADARNCIVILTSNILGQKRSEKSVGFAPTPSGAAASPAAPSQAELRSSVLRHLPRKLVDRIDSIVLFKELTENELAAIARQNVEEVLQRVTALHEVSFEVAPEVYSWLARKAAESGAGARDIQRAVDQHVGNALSEHLRSGTEGLQTVKICVVNDAVLLKTTEKQENGQKFVR